MSWGQKLNEVVMNEKLFLCKSALSHIAKEIKIIYHHSLQRYTESGTVHISIVSIKFYAFKLTTETKQKLTYVHN